MKTCRGLHKVLVADEYNAMGAVVSCLICGDTFHINENTLEERYYHAHHPSPEGPGGDRDFFLLDQFVEGR